jgi:hypothetical protein
MASTATAVTLIERPSGHFWTGSFTLDPSSLTTLTGEVATITVPGVAVGDIATVCPQTALTTGIVISYVRCAANTITVGIFNATGGTIDVKPRGRGTSWSPAARRWASGDGGMTTLATPHRRLVPPEWERQLAELSPPTNRFSWLKLVWEPGRPDAVIERFIVYQMVPAHAVQTEILDQLQRVYTAPRLLRLGAAASTSMRKTASSRRARGTCTARRSAGAGPTGSCKARRAATNAGSPTSSGSCSRSRAAL